MTLLLCFWHVPKDRWLQTPAESSLFSAPDAIVKAKKKEIKRDHTAKLLSLVNKDALTEYLNSDEFKAEWKKKAREILTEQVRRTPQSRGLFISRSAFTEQAMVSQGRILKVQVVAVPLKICCFGLLLFVLGISSSRSGAIVATL